MQCRFRRVLDEAVRLLPERILENADEVGPAHLERDELVSPQDQELVRAVHGVSVRSQDQGLSA